MSGADVENSGAENLRPLNVYIASGCDEALRVVPGASRSERIRNMMHAVIAAREAENSTAFLAAVQAAETTSLAQGSFSKVTAWVSQKLMRKMIEHLDGSGLSPSDLVKGALLVLMDLSDTNKNEEVDP